MRIVKIAFIGGESSGKTTIATHLFDKLRMVAPTKYVAEYGRLLGEYTDNVYERSDMAHIGSVQVRMEDAAARHLTPHLSNAHPVGFVLCDTTPLVTRYYSETWYGSVDPILASSAEKRKYDYLFLCLRDFPHVNDGTRIGPEFSADQERYYRLHAPQRFIELSGDPMARASVVLSTLMKDGLYGPNAS